MRNAWHRFTQAFSVLAVPDMRRVWLSQVLSEVGDWAARFALAVLVFDRSNSPFLAASTLAVTYLPYLLSPVVTPIAQKWSLRSLMIGSDVVRMALFLLIALPLPTWSLLVLAFIAGLATPPFEAARSAVIPEATGEDRMGDGYALSNVTFQVVQVAGLGVGGLLLLAIGPASAVVLNAATFGVSALILVRLRAGRRPPQPEPPLTRTKRAFSAVARRGLLRQMVVFFLLLAMADAAISALLPVLLRSNDVNPIVMASLIAVAPLVGAASGAAVPREGGSARLLRISCTITVLAATPAAVFFAFAEQSSQGLTVLVTLVAVTAYGVTIAADVPTMTGSMMLVPEDFRAPFVAVIQPGLMGVQAFAAFAAGASASVLSTTSTMALSLVVPVAYSLWVLARTLPPATIDLRKEGRTVQLPESAPTAADGQSALP